MLVECLICEKQSFSLGEAECQDCPEGANCLGGSQLETLPGYWRDSETSSMIEKCYQLEANCVGGLKWDNELCYKGHFGALCEECDVHNLKIQLRSIIILFKQIEGLVWKDKYGKETNFSCVNCANIAGNLYWLLVSYTIILLSIFFTVKQDVFARQEKVQNQNLFLNIIKQGNFQIITRKK